MNFSDKIKKMSVIDILLVLVALYAMYMLYNCTMNRKENMVPNMDDYVQYQPVEKAPVPNTPVTAPKDQNTSCGAGNFVSTSLLPKTNDVIRDDGFQFAPDNLQNINFLEAPDKIGVDTVGNSLRNANRQIRNEPANPKTPVSPWMNSTIEPDLARGSL